MTPRCARPAAGRCLAAAQAALAALQVGALLVVADRVAGGVVAFQLGLNFQSLPIAIGATPVALSLVPRLARMTGPAQAGMFRDTYVRGLSFAAFLVIPAATAYAVIAQPLAGAIGFGAFAKGGGRTLLAAALAGLALAVVGETMFAVSSYACYARKDTAHPLRGMIIQAAVCAVGIAVAVQFHGTAVLFGLGLAYSFGAVAAAGYLIYHLRRRLPHGGEPALRPLLRTLACSAIMAVPVWASAHFIADRARQCPRTRRHHARDLRGGSRHLFRRAGGDGCPADRVGDGSAAEQTGPAARPSPAPSGAVGSHPLRTFSLGVSAGVMQRIGPTLRRRRLDALMLLVPLGVGALAAVKMKYAIGAAVIILLVGWVMLRPVIAAYLLIFMTPLVVGLNAGLVVPGLRANEGLIVVVGLGVALRWLVRVRTGEVRWPRIGPVDVSLVALCVFSSVVPLAMMLVRQRPITSDDFLYAIVLWKLFAEYVIVRLAVTTREQALRCLVLLLVASAIVAVVGVVQAVGLPGVAGLLNKYISTGDVAAAESGTRGSSLLGLPAATADLAILSLGVAIAMITRGYPRRRWLAALAVLYVLGVFAASEFATVIGLVIAVVALMFLTQERPARRLCGSGRAAGRGPALAGDPDPARRLPVRVRPSAELGRPARQPPHLLLAALVLGQQLDPGRAAVGPRRLVDAGGRLRMDRERLYLAALGRRDPAARQLLRVRGQRAAPWLGVRAACRSGWGRRHRGGRGHVRPGGSHDFRPSSDLPRLGRRAVHVAGSHPGPARAAPARRPPQAARCRGGGRSPARGSVRMNVRHSSLAVVRPAQPSGAILVRTYIAAEKHARGKGLAVRQS